MAAPLACDLGVFTPQERSRHAESLERLRGLIETTEPLVDGMAWRLPASAEAIRLAADFVAYERLCCPFFNFALEVAPERGPVWLRLTGGEGVRRFIQQEFSQ